MKKLNSFTLILLISCATDCPQYKGNPYNGEMPDIILCYFNKDIDRMVCEKEEDYGR